MALPGGAVPVGPARPPTVQYREFFADAATDVFNGEYTDLLAPYITPVGLPATHTPQDCRTLAYDARNQGVPTAFLLQHNDDNKLHIYLQLDRVTARMGMPATGWENRTFCGKGDLRHNQHVMVEFIDTYWNRCAGYYTGDDATIDNALTADPNAQILGPFAAGDAGTVQRRTCHTIVVPPAYVAPFLAAPLTPRQAWETVRAQVVADGREGPCAPFIDYLRLALTAEHVGDTESPLAIAPPTVPLADNFLLDRRQAILETDFPILNSALAGIQQNQIANELHTLVNVTQTANSDANARRLADRNKSPSEFLGATGAISLQRYSHAATAQGVTNFWHLIANSKKGQHLNILQWEINRVKEELNELDLPFAVNGSILEAVKSLQWAMATNDSVDTGFSPWLLSEATTANNSTAQSIYEMLYGNGASPSLADATSLIKAKPGAPRHLYQARIQIRKFHIINAVTLGLQFPLCRAMHTYYNRFIAMEGILHQLHSEDILLPTKLLKRFSVQVSQWYRRQAASPAAIPPPNFEQVFDDIENERPWAPILSLPFLTALNLQQFHPSNRPRIEQQPGQQNGGGGNGTGTPRGGGGGNAPGGNGGGGGGAIPNERANNPSFNTALFGTYKAMTVTCRSLRGKISRGELPPLPLSKVDQSPVCLAWHTKGLCNQACSRCPDHVQYTSSEYQPLVQWCAENFHE